MKKLIFICASVFLLSCGSKTNKAVVDTDSLAIDSVADAGLDKHSDACQPAGTDRHLRLKDLIGVRGGIQLRIQETGDPGKPIVCGPSGHHQTIDGQNAQNRDAR